jgi:hypothetical protein
LFVSFQILEELKGLCVPENVVLPENPESEAASDQGLHRVSIVLSFLYSGLFESILESRVFAGSGPTNDSLG